MSWKIFENLMKNITENATENIPGESALTTHISCVYPKTHEYPIRFLPKQSTRNYKNEKHEFSGSIKKELHNQGVPNIPIIHMPLVPGITKKTEESNKEIITHKFI